MIKFFLNTCIVGIILLGFTMILNGCDSHKEVTTTAVTEPSSLLIEDNEASSIMTEVSSHR